MPFLVTGAIAFLSGALGWAWFTKPDAEAGEAETVFERITTNLGAAVVAGGACVAALWLWQKRGR